MAKYKVGFIGCGGISRAHADGYKHARNAQIEFVAGSDIDPDGEKARRLADEYGVKLYADHEVMLAQEDLDLISICTWPRGHCEATVAAAGYSVKGILCEKPMAVTLEQADRMIHACGQADVALAIGHAHRFSPQAVRARELAQAGEIGHVKMIWGHCSLDLMNNGTHVLDLIHYFNGNEPAEWILGQIDCRSQTEGRANHPDMVASLRASAARHHQPDILLRLMRKMGFFSPPVSPMLRSVGKNCGAKRYWWTTEYSR